MGKRGKTEKERKQLDMVSSDHLKLCLADTNSSPLCSLQCKVYRGNAPWSPYKRPFVEHAAL